MNEKCTKCGGTIIAIPRPDTPHYAERRCEKCDAFYGWLSHPDNEGKRQKSKFEIKIDFCQFCGRKKHELGKNETLTTDHTIPLGEGGKDEEKNVIVLCSACHKLKHWLRLYFYTHWEGVRWKGS
jgi:5-methylcytosine-specific restriction endonuclease McrA